MRLNPFRIPELRDLPDTVSRKEVVRSVKKRLVWQIRLEYLALLGMASYPIIFVIGGMIYGFGVWDGIVIALLGIFAFGMILFARYERRIKIRKILRTEHEVPICLCCGYLGVSMDTQICSECGKPVEGSLTDK